MNASGQYEIPPWAAVPPPGMHLDVMKGDKLVQKLMIDQKSHYLFGRNPQQNDFCVEHASCSRVHCVFLYHSQLERAFLVDLGSTHGTYIGNIRLEAHKPTQLQLDTRFHFGASTREYIMRERPNHQGSRSTMTELEKLNSDNDGGLLGLPETDNELDNLTEFNTAHNRRISMLGIPDDDKNKRKRRKNLHLSFNDEDEVINPEDVDPTIGRFRNLVQSTVIPSANKKRPKLDHGLVPHHPPVKHHHFVQRVSMNLYDDDIQPDQSVATPFFTSLSTKLGLPVPNPAPDIEEEALKQPIHIPAQPVYAASRPPPDNSNEPKKKKYAKEAWPGKKHGSNLLV